MEDLFRFYNWNLKRKDEITDKAPTSCITNSIIILCFVSIMLILGHSKLLETSDKPRVLVLR